MPPSVTYRFSNNPSRNLASSILAHALLILSSVSFPSFISLRMASEKTGPCICMSTPPSTDKKNALVVFSAIRWRVLIASISIQSLTMNPSNPYSLRMMSVINHLFAWHGTPFNSLCAGIRVKGLASCMAVLNGGKKIFLSLPSLNSTGPALVPLLAIPPATRCLAQANTVFNPVRLSVCRPLMHATPMRDTRYGSSPNVSPTLPQRASQAISMLGVKAQ